MHLIFLLDLITEGYCNSTCNGRGACLFDGSRGQCYCNAGFHGPECEFTGYIYIYIFIFFQVAS